MPSTIDVQTRSLQNSETKKSLVQVKISLPSLAKPRSALTNKFSPRKEKGNSAVASLDLRAILEQCKRSADLMAKDSEETPIVNYLKRQQPY